MKTPTITATMSRTIRLSTFPSYQHVPTTSFPNPGRMSRTYEHRHHPRRDQRPDQRPDSCRSPRTRSRDSRPIRSGEIARQSGVDLPIVIERIQAMLRAGTIRRVRQTLMATNLAKGSLVAWQVPEEKLAAAFDYMFQQDPFSGHVVIRSTDAGITQTKYRLWTTLKVPQGYSMAKHCEFLMQKTGATSYRLMPAKRLFALGVGHVRRRGMEPGSKSDELAEVIDTEIVELNDLDWRVLTALEAGVRGRRNPHRSLAAAGRPRPACR